MARVFHLMQLGTPALQARTIVGGVSAAPLTATGSTQGTALLLADTNSLFGTVASGTGAILFPTADTNAGDAITVTNLGANALLVYPQTGGTIQGGAANAGFSVPAGKTAMFIARNAVDWLVNLSA